MSARVCLITVTDLRGVRRSVEVTATSVYEAGALAIAALREDGWDEPIGRPTRLTIEVRPPPITHTVTDRAVDGERRPEPRESTTEGSDPGGG